MSFSPIEQAVMFLAGANSIFTGDKARTALSPSHPPPAFIPVLIVCACACAASFSAQLLTTPNPAFDEDQMMFDSLGLQGKKAFANPLKPPPGYVEPPPQEAPLIPLPPSQVPPSAPPKKWSARVPPSAPRPPQPAMHASSKE